MVLMIERQLASLHHPLLLLLQML
ncbi:hypothetical protein Goarm_005214 [Gossypium armourianum]|uniref:Uncharacterized protein n=1 Tax=Gossypium armourianum TaxID=34283 RepID=A0A7J9JZ84_9ROSI|nr:hypothetical protein [Gossypium armourianum]